MPVTAVLFVFSCVLSFELIAIGANAVSFATDAAGDDDALFTPAGKSDWRDWSATEDPSSALDKFWAIDKSWETEAEASEA